MYVSTFVRSSARFRFPTAQPWLLGLARNRTSRTRMRFAASNSTAAPSLPAVGCKSGWIPATCQVMGQLSQGMAQDLKCILTERTPGCRGHLAGRPLLAARSSIRAATPFLMETRGAVPPRRVMDRRGKSNLQAACSSSLCARSQHYFVQRGFESESAGVCAWARAPARHLRCGQILLAMSASIFTMRIQFSSIYSAVE
jgi:hypothetical protein